MVPWEEKLRRFGPIGTLIAALGCASCFPFLGALAAALGLGFLSGYESLLINWAVTPLTILLFGLALLMSRRKEDPPARKVLRIVGPSGMLFALFWIWNTPLREPLFLLGLAITLGVAIWDWKRPCGCGDEEASGS